MNQGRFPRRSQETQEALSTLFRRPQEPRLAVILAGVIVWQVLHSQDRSRKE